MTDPWTLHADLACPSCRAAGKVVRFEREDDGYRCGCDDSDDDHLEDIDPFTCVECGHAWVQADTLLPQALKEARVHWSRLVEGRPYEPPRFDLAKEQAPAVTETASKPLAPEWNISNNTWKLTGALTLVSAPAIELTMYVYDGREWTEVDAADDRWRAAQVRWVPEGDE